VILKGLNIETEAGWTVGDEIAFERAGSATGVAEWSLPIIDREYRFRLFDEVVRVFGSI
jgi:hypothetical protein